MNTITEVGVAHSEAVANEAVDGDAASDSGRMRRWAAVRDADAAMCELPHCCCCSNARCTATR